MKKDLPKGRRYLMNFEIGQYYMGYENPAKILSHEQKFMKNEWTVFVRTINPTFRPYISQFINYVDFDIPRKDKLITVEPPKRHFSNA